MTEYRGIYGPFLYPETKYHSPYKYLKHGSFSKNVTVNMLRLLRKKKTESDHPP